MIGYKRKNTVSKTNGVKIQNIKRIFGYLIVNESE